MESNYLWWSVLLSAVVFEIAFLFPVCLGFLIVLFIPILYVFFNQKYSLIMSFKAGMVWGLIVFSFHFTWLLLVLRGHSKAPVEISFLLYGLIVFYFSLSSGLWFVLTRLMSRFFSVLMSLLISSVIYWVTLEFFILLPLGLGRGYPFLNPFIALAWYKWFLKIIVMVAMFGSEKNKIPIITERVCKVTYLEPVVNKIKNQYQSWAHDPDGLAQQIYHNIIEKIIPNKQQIFVAPESYFSFPLNQFSHLISLWSSALKPQDHLLLGSIYKEKGQIFQCVFWINRGLIIDFYVKKHAVPLVEKVPRLWKNIKIIRGAFLDDNNEFSDEKEGRTSSFFDLVPHERIIPQLCSEFFFKSAWYDFYPYTEQDKRNKIFFFVNDSWFDAYFRKTLQGLTFLKSKLIGLPVVYIGHHGIINDLEYTSSSVAAAVLVQGV